MVNSVVSDQIAENGNSVDADQTVPENDSVELDLDQSAENGE